MRDVGSKPCLFSLLILSSVALLSVVTFPSPLSQVQAPPSPTTAPAAQTSQPEFKLRVQKNVVVVRVVVRDSKGRAVNGLRQEDFRISDNKKPQEIGSFSVETSEAAAMPAQPSAAAPPAKPGQEAAAAPAAPVSYLAFYFDDLYSAQDSLYRAGQAAEKFLAGLPPTERVAIFTSSGLQTLDFTDDRQKIHDVLMKLRANSHASPKGRCPEINDYLAYRIVEGNYKDPAMGIIGDEAVNVCRWPPLMATPDHLRALVYEAYEAYRFQSRATLKNLENVIERVARMPGERQVMLVSDGFMDLEMNNRVEAVVDRALRAHVTISALVGAGLTVDMVEMDTSRGYMPSPDLSTLINVYAAARKVAATGTLAEIADGTGGQFFHDNNDLLAGMRKILLPPEVSYVLTFSPTELKADGAFHALKVTLANGQGLTIQARKGYFAPKGQVSPEELAKTEIREAIYSSYPIQDLPLTFETEVHKAEGQTEEIEVQAVLDVRNLAFEKQGDLNLDKVVFAVGLFDHDGKYVTGSQQTYSLSLKDATRAEMEKRGLALKTHVSAKTGAYTVRVVVRDSQGGEMAALSKAVEVPSQISPPAMQQVVPSGPAGASDTQGGKTAASSKADEFPSPTPPPVAPSGPPVGSGSKRAEVASPEEAAKNELRKAIYSSYPIQDLPLTFEPEVHKGKGQYADIAISAQLDIRNLPFEKQGDRSLDNVVFAVGVFDHNGKYLSGGQQTYALSLTDTKRAEMEKRGLSLWALVPAKPGAYIVRVVVRDSQGGKMAASSKAVDVPSQIAPPAAPPVAPSGPPAGSGSKGGEVAALGKTTEVPLRTLPPPTAKLVAPADEPFFEDYSRSDPITKWPLKETKNRIPELNGLKPATDQSQLPGILRGVSENLQKFTTNFVNIAATESVDEAVKLRGPREGSDGWGNDAYGVEQMAGQVVQKYRYLVMGRKEGEALTLVEYRTDLRGREAPADKLSKKYVKTTGFAAMPLFFGPFEQPWSDFRLLGQQTIGRDRTQVVAFAEHIEPGAVMGRFNFGERSIPILLQGVAWIRSSDYQIIKMRTDLLGALPSAALQQVTTVVLFASNRFQEASQPLWLPQKVEVRVGLGPYVFTNRHRYSDYRMFRVKSVIKTDVPTAQ